MLLTARRAHALDLGRVGEDGIELVGALLLAFEIPRAGTGYPAVEMIAVGQNS